MTKTELKIVLKLHHDWKVNYRVDYAILLLEYTEGKILSMFESAASEEIQVYHAHGFRDDEINWYTVYSMAARTMSRIAKEVADGTL